METAGAFEFGSVFDMKVFFFFGEVEDGAIPVTKAPTLARTQYVHMPSESFAAAAQGPAGAAGPSTGGCRSFTTERLGAPLRSLGVRFTVTVSGNTSALRPTVTVTCHGPGAGPVAGVGSAQPAAVTCHGGPLAVARAAPRLSADRDRAPTPTRSGLPPRPGPGGPGRGQLSR